MRKYSENLKQYIEFEQYGNNITVLCEDGTIYDPQEMKLLTEAKEKTPLRVHFIKGVFKGKIIAVEKSGK